MSQWVDECWRLAAVLAVALMAGIIGGKVLLALTLALALYTAWMILRFAELHRWLEGGAKTNETPDTVGLASTIVQLVHRERLHRKREKKKLRNTLQQFNTLAAELPDATVVLDDKWQIQWCNTAAETLLGLSRKRDTGQRIDNLIRLPEFHLFLNGINIDDGGGIEFPSPVNPELTILMTCVPAGQNMQILTGRDITQRVHVREMRKAFVADVSHELRTPLTVIQGHMEILTDDLSDESYTDTKSRGQLRQALERVSEHTTRMSQIVADLLTLSKLENNVLRDGQGESLDLTAIINTIVKDANSISANSHPISVTVDHGLRLLAMNTEIHSAFQNLVSNAIAYTQAGTQIQVQWSANSKGGARFEVRDHGAGIEPQHVPRLSQRFYRVDTARSRESGGTGLGLAIVKHIAQRHGAELDIKSELGVGSVFAIDFPGARVLPSEPEHQQLAAL